MLEGNVDRSKKDMRKTFLTTRINLESKVVTENSKKICDHVIDHPMFKKAEKIMAYMPTKNEVDIREIIEKAWSLNKKILLPKVKMESKSMEPYAIASWGDLEVGNYGIYEPREKGNTPSLLEDIGLVLVPAVAFDMRGYRLGYGGGYYDRFFDRFTKSPYKIGIAYDFQVVPELPKSFHDYKVNEVITEIKSIVFE